MRAIIPTLLLIAACSSPAVCGGCSGDDGGLPDGLPDSFRVEAEIVSAEGSTACTPGSSDINPEGPDWILFFSSMHDAAEPSFSENTSGDSAERCRAGGEADCCQPLAESGDGWRLSCLGAVEGLGRSRFEFTFNADGSGSSVSTWVNATSGQTLCTVRAEWLAIIPQ